MSIGVRFAQHRVRTTQGLSIIALGLLAVSHRAAEDLIWAPVMFFMGVLLVAVGALGRIWCGLYIAGYKNGALVTVGPYSMCRNPLYFFNLVALAGLGLATLTLTLTLLFVGMFATLYPAVIAQEEQELRRRHGEAFDRYRRVVPGFLPRLRLLVEPDIYPVKVRVLRRHFADLLSLLTMLGLLEALEQIHHSGFLPVWLVLY